MRALAFSLLLGLFALLSGLSVSAQPYGPPYRGDPRDAPRDGVQPLDRLLPGIRREHPGDFYDAEGPTYGPSGDPHYHLKWMTPDGRVIWFDTDARNGRVLRSSPGRDSFDNHRPEYPPGYARPNMDRYPPPYERGYGRERNFAPAPGYDRPDFGRGGFGGRGDFGGRGGDGRGGGRWRR